MNKNNDNKNHSEKPALLMILISRCKFAFGQKRVFNRVLALVMAKLFDFGRHTIPVFSAVSILWKDPVFVTVVQYLTLFLQIAGLLCSCIKENCSF